ncbi:SDR family oxidoreductase [Chenggangzhangella methanolivorans]|uniref:SDR family oxidoreductase n=1 Tax=Chenggangzhangella methanolivorans TaxID=1437009 RepID=UPI0036225430
MASKVLVLGASGTVGRPLVRALVAKGVSVKAASRSGAPIEGAEGVRFDFGDPATYGPALEVVDGAYLLAPTGTTDVPGRLLPVVEAAAARGVKIVLQTVMGADADEANPYRRVERAVEASGRPFVILRPNWFADNFHTFWKPGVAVGEIALPAGDGASSFVDARDIADSAVGALTSDRFDGHAFTLTGPQALGYAAAAEVLSSALGRPVAYRAIDDETFVAALVSGGVPEDYARFLATIFEPVRAGHTAPTTGDVETLSGHAPRTLADYARDNAAALSS